MISKRGNVTATPGQPLKFTEETEVVESPVSAVGAAIAETLRAYGKAARKLLEEKYAAVGDLAPLHLRAAGDVFVLRCRDGIVVRYDPPPPEGEPKIRFSDSAESVATLAPKFSEQVIHFPDDPATFVPTVAPEIVFFSTDPTGGEKEVFRQRTYVVGSLTLPAGFEMPSPGNRPVCVISMQKTLDMFMQGKLVPVGAPSSADAPGEQFIVHSRFDLKVGWQAIEVYPPLGEEYWKPELAALWAELDLLAAIAQKNLTATQLRGLDPRAAARKGYAVLLAEFATLLDGPEEPVHQFLKAHPELLSPTHEQMWSKFEFGDTVSDFVFREPANDYLLVEIEAPYRELFRKDGQPRQELTHAINQTEDWIQHIVDNKPAVEQEPGLVGISTNPRTLVVIGRTAALSAENRRRLVTMQDRNPKLRIMTYDDLAAHARANLERILGPLSVVTVGADVYFFKGHS